MEQLVGEVFDIIKDYRADEGLMTVERVRTWINQFDQNDRVFVLEELKNILSKRYISMEKGRILVKEMIEFLAGKYKYKTPEQFLLDSNFIDHQPEGKSQKVLLKFVDEIIQKEFGITIKDCQPKKPKFFLYFDDVLCTGDTLVKGLTGIGPENSGWFQQKKDGKTNLEIFRENNGQLILAYFAIHRLNIKKARNRIYYGLGKQNVDFTYAWDTRYAIENDLTDVNSRLNIILPKESVRDKLVIDCQNQIEGKIKGAGYHEGETIRYREINRPSKEEFFSSEANRDRFEKIILDKCITIYNTSNNLMTNLRPKPLGYGLKSDLSLGFGTLIFTWRNVPFNTPLVFWYQSQHWTSLFERKYISY